MLRIGPHVAALLIVVALLAGCAGSPGAVRAVGTSTSAAELEAFRALDLQLSASPGVAVEPDDLARLGQLVLAQLAEMAPGRFATVETRVGAAEGGVVATVSAPIPDLRAELEMTRYDAGNAFARAMLAGLGQMHIDGRLRLRDGRDGSELGAYEVAKTFAWGGIYGAATGIRDLEPAFAEAVALAILGRPAT